MKKQQLILTGAGLFLLIGLLVFGTNETPKKPVAAGKPTTSNSFDVQTLIRSAAAKLPLYQQNYLTQLENSVSRGDVRSQQLEAYNQLARFWEDSSHNHTLYIFYTGKAAELVNSEKNLTFAAQQFLGDLRNEQNLVQRGWKAEQAISLFEKAIALNPTNDSLKVGLGSCYVFGKGMAGDAGETMKGIQQLLQIVQKDSSNMQAQMVLGIGGVISTQYDKAISRLETVVKNEPNNLEAISWLADAYAAKGDKANAVKWYQITKRMINNPEYSKEVDERIKNLR